MQTGRRSPGPQQVEWAGENGSGQQKCQRATPTHPPSFRGLSGCSLLLCTLGSEWWSRPGRGLCLQSPLSTVHPGLHGPGTTTRPGGGAGETRPPKPPHPSLPLPSLSSIIISSTQGLNTSAYIPSFFMLCRRLNLGLPCASQAFHHRATFPAC